MKILVHSKSSTISDTPCQDPIHIFTQFFIHRDPARHKEIQFCLRKNCENPLVHKIHLLGERIYTMAEMGLSDKYTNPQFTNKIVQTVVGRRLRFQDVFSYIHANNILGYHVLINSDICFADNALLNLQKSDIHLSKKMYALLRFEYNTSDPKKSPIFGPRFDSQDTWIFHSNFPIFLKEGKPFNFEFGRPGCDNKLIYLLQILGYEILNDPLFIKTYHVHKSQTRDYGFKDVISQPWGMVVPANMDPLLMAPSLGVDPRQISLATRNFQDVQFGDNKVLFEYISQKIAKNKHFVIPRISGIENNFAVFAHIIQTKGPAHTGQLLEYIKQWVPTMKSNAGIILPSMQSVIQFSEHYLKAFEYCEVMAGWEIYGEYIKHISQSHAYIKQKYMTDANNMIQKKLDHKMIWTMALDIYHYIHSTPWTLALRGKRILLISPFEDTLREKIPVRSKIYGIDLFPDCEITTIRPPQTQAAEIGDEFIVEFERFKVRLDAIKDTYDVALVSCGGYANPVCAYLFECGKSAIYVGGVLQMYFGILGQRWLTDRPDVVRLYLNEHWSSPKNSEKPAGFNKVEGGCYW